MPRIKDALFPLRKRSRYLLFCAVMLAVLFVLLILAAGLGSVSLPFETIRSIIVNTVMKKEVYPVTWEESAETILLGIRMPRILTAFIVGAGLTLCGILMQALTKNPLADPYVLGISHGASAGAVSVIMYGYLKFLGGYGTMVGAFCGAVISIALALKIAAIRNKVTATQLVLAGIAVSALFGAITNFMIYHTKTGSDKVKTATYWMMGSLSGASWEKLKYATIAFVICLIFILFLSKGLDVLLLGDDVAVTVGVNTERLKMGIIILATLLTGVIVSISGTIGFVGLTIPHITRSIVGTKHKRLIPASVLVGGTFLVAADIISRVAVAPEELPIGVDHIPCGCSPGGTADRRCICLFRSTVFPVSDQEIPRNIWGVKRMKLEVKDITYSIDGKLIVDGVSLGIREGDFVGLVGPNGCGKSTLLKNIYKVYKPDAGAVFIDGKSTADMSSRETAREMSVMQQENNVEFDMTVYDMVMLGRYAHQKMFGTDMVSEREKVLAGIREVGMEGFEERSFLSLSGGEKQRTLVARALVQQAKLMILDEPTNHLDIGYQYQIMNILKRQNLTVFSSIHDLNVAACYCDRILLMKKGRIVDAGTPEQVFVPDKIRNLFGIDSSITINKATGRPNIMFMPQV